MANNGGVKLSTLDIVPKVAAEMRHFRFVAHQNPEQGVLRQHGRKSPPELSRVTAMELKHTRLVPQASVKDAGAIAAGAVADAGGSPRAQIDAARQVSGQVLGYTSHQGLKQRQKNLERMAKAAAKAAAKNPS